MRLTIRNCVMASALAVVILVGWFFERAWADFRRDYMLDAASSGDTRAMSRLIALGADPSMVGWEGHHTPLERAVMAGQVGAVKYLLNRGVDVNRKDDFGGTALDYAMHYNRPDIAKLLKDAGARE